MKLLIFWDKSKQLALINHQNINILRGNRDLFLKYKMGLELVPYNLNILVYYEWGKIKNPLKINDLSGFSIYCYSICDPAEARTQDPMLKRHMLYQLSYGIVA